MDDRLTVVVHDYTHFEQRAVDPRPDVHGHGVVVGCEGDHVLSVGVEHVVVGDAVPSGGGLDLHRPRLDTPRVAVNMC